MSLGHDQDGDEVTSCVVEVQNEGDYNTEKASQKPIGGNQKILLETFDQMVANNVSRPNPDKAGKFHTVKMDAFRERCMGKLDAINKRGAFGEALKALCDKRGQFGVASDLVWRIDRIIK